MWKQWVKINKNLKEWIRNKEKLGNISLPNVKGMYIETNLMNFKDLRGT